MTLYTKKGVDVFAPTTAGGAARPVDNGEAQVWAAEVEARVEQVAEAVSSNIRTRLTPVDLATTANITLSGEQTIDGTLTSTSRVLVKNQSSKAANGIYVTGAGVWTRAMDADTTAEIYFAAVYVSGGTAGAGKTYWCDLISTETLGTDAHDWILIDDADFGDGAIANAKLANMAADTIKGRASGGGTGAPEDLTAAQVRTILNVEDGATADMTGAQIKAAYEGEADTNAFTDTEKTKLASIEAGAQVNAVTSVAGKTGAVTLVKTDVSLGNVDNTSDADKPVSTAQQAALDLKADASDLAAAITLLSNETAAVLAAAAAGDAGLASSVAAEQEARQATFTSLQTQVNSKAGQDDLDTLGQEVAEARGTADTLADAIAGGGSLSTPMAPFPGEVTSLFTTSLSGGDPIALPAFNPASITAGANGPVAQVAGGGTIAVRQMTRVVPGRKYVATYAFQRTVNTSDPSSDTVRAALACYSSTRNRLTSTDAYRTVRQIDDLEVADGRQTARATIGFDAASDIVLPTSCRYIRAYLEAFGTGSTSTVEIMRIDDVTDIVSGAGLVPDAYGLLADRDDYNAEDESFVYAATDDGELNAYIRQGSTGSWIGPFPLRGAAGPAGSVVEIDLLFDDYDVMQAAAADYAHNRGAQLYVGEGDDQNGRYRKDGDIGVGSFVFNRPLGDEEINNRIGTLEGAVIGLNDDKAPKANPSFTEAMEMEGVITQKSAIADRLYMLGRRVIWRLAANGKVLLPIFRDGSIGLGEVRALPGGRRSYVDRQRVLWSIKDRLGRIMLSVLRDGSVGLGNVRFVGVGEGDAVYVNAKGRRAKVVFGLRTRNRKILLAVLDDGTVYLPKAIVSEYDTISTDSLNGPGNAFAPRRYSDGLIQYLADGEGATRSYIQRVDIPSTTAMFESGPLLEFLPMMGESLSVGGVSGSPAVVTGTAPFAHHAFMLNDGARGKQLAAVDPASIYDLVPIVEATLSTTNGETPGSGALRYLHEQTVQEEERFRTWVFRSHGANGYKIDDVDSGSIPYANGLAELTRLITIAEAYGKKVMVRAMLSDIGVNDRNAGTARATFKSLMEAYVDDMQADWGALIPHQTDPIMLLIAQTDATTGASGNAGMPAFVQYELSRDRDDVRISHPKYMLPKADSVHLTALGNALDGEYFARAWRRLFVDGESRAAVEPIAFTRNSGTELDIQFHVPTPPLVFDTTTLPNVGDGKGIELYEADGTTAITISNAMIVGDDTVRITHASYTGTMVVRCADEGTGNTGYSGAWSNICDSTVAASIADPSFNLANWAIIFEETLS